MIELLYKRKDKFVDLGKRPLLPEKAKVFELTEVKNLKSDQNKRLQSTYNKSNGKCTFGSNYTVKSFWNHFNHDLMERIRIIRSNDVQNNLRAV